MLKKALIAIVVSLVLTIGLFCIVVAIQPEDFTVTRSASMAARPEVIFAQINDFHKWDAWSPWAKIDPDMKVQYGGPEAGKGASYLWHGNEQAGEGKMTIRESQPPQKVAIDLEFIKPFASNNDITFNITPNGTSSDVTWTMSGKNNFLAKAFSLMMNMDTLVGGDFEKGLAQMKTVVESGPKTDPAPAAADIK